MADAALRRDQPVWSMVRFIHLTEVAEQESVDVCDYGKEGERYAPMFRAILYWCVMLLSALFVLMPVPSLLATLLGLDVSPRFLPLGSLMASALGLGRAVCALWGAGDDPTPTYTGHQDSERAGKRLALNGTHPPTAR
jgi:hypothetical protein